MRFGNCRSGRRKRCWRSRTGAGFSRILETCPDLGPIRIAQLLAVVVTPYRFSNKRAFWIYAGLGIDMRSSSDWVWAKDGSWTYLPVQQTRGLNRNFNRSLKQVF